MTDEPRKLTINDVIGFVQIAWDPTELEVRRQEITGEVVPFVVPWALIEAFIAQHVAAPEVWFSWPVDRRVMAVLELIRRGAEAAEGKWDAELDAFLADTLGESSDVDGE